jgi:WS/DGAT/MGAT family acyltransferase
LAIRAGALADLVGTTAQQASETPLNQPLGPHRRYDYLVVPLWQFKAVSKAMQCTLNDVVLATVAGAMREFLMSRLVHPEDTEFRIAAPVNVRRKEERGVLGNGVSNWFIPLPIGEADPRKRLETIQKLTQKLKTSQQALGVQMMMAVVEWTPTVVLSAAMRGASTASNMIVTNVPGPQETLYLLGAKLLHMFPAAPLLENQGLSVALLSYARTLGWGLTADYELVPDLEKFVGLIESAFQELAVAAGVDLTTAPVAGVATPSSEASAPDNKRKRARTTARTAGARKRRRPGQDGGEAVAKPPKARGERSGA